MKVSEVMAGITPDPKFTGIVTNDDFILAIDTSETQDAEVDDYEVIQGAVGSVGSELDAETETKTYIREGEVETKIGTRRTYPVTGDRKIGVPFQDFCFSHSIIYGTGQKVVRPYARFCMLTGKGEKGKAAIIVNSDGGGDAGNTAEFDVNISVSGTPEEYTYTPKPSVEV